MHISLCKGIVMDYWHDEESDLRQEALSNIQERDWIQSYRIALGLGFSIGPVACIFMMLVFESFFTGVVTGGLLFAVTVGPILLQRYRPQWFLSRQQRLANRLELEMEQIRQERPKRKSEHAYKLGDDGEIEQISSYSESQLEEKPKNDHDSIQN